MKKLYTYPAVEVISFVAEKGFADSFDTTITNYNKTGADSLDD